MSQTEKERDGLLILDYQSGNKMALAALVKRWHKKFCTKAFYIVKDADEAKDVAQDSWRTIIDKLEDIRDPQSFGGWALRIVHTKSIDALRKRQKERKVGNAFKQETDIIDEPYDERLNLKKKLYSAILELPTDQQYVVKLFYLEELPLNDISKLLNIKAGTVKSRLFHAREKLKKSIKKHKG
ncbi:sigma-70 family RNA polymerase sigma factor [Pontimicrobium sp. SW4]|uniref:Sigma-70 family RNA polymerase sigma factor n=1 Tax=Pontimicrobium sp. SW4 TaxID=3153519 RepID=A0AAU7BNT0_9FLAO